MCGYDGRYVWFVRPRRLPHGGSNNDSHGAMVLFPDESPFPNMPTNTTDRRLMAMPAYLGGDFKLVALNGTAPILPTVKKDCHVQFLCLF